MRAIALVSFLFTASIAFSQTREECDRLWAEDLKSRLSQAKAAAEKPKNENKPLSNLPDVYPKPDLPGACFSAQARRERTIAVAKSYQGLPDTLYTQTKKKGPDCSSFTAWVYNLGLGIHLSSDVAKQAESAGRLLEPDEAFQPGDLLFLWKKEKKTIGHVAIYVDKDHVIDSAAASPGEVADNSDVRLRKFKGWYKTRLAWARRVIE